MQSINFQLLQEKWPKLYEHAHNAEYYTYTDPHTATIKLRCFAEQLVGVLYRELNIPCERNDGFFEKLKSKNFIDIIDENILQKLHAIRILGNKAAHGGDINSSDALTLLEDAYLVGQWLFKTYSQATHIDYPQFIKPNHPDNTLERLNQNNAQLSEQLLQAKKDLEEIEESERLAQLKAQKLQKELNHFKIDKFKASSERAISTFDLAPDNTRELIKLHDVFSEYKLTSGQASLVKNIEEFLNSTQDNVFLLKGYAGTGKTFITKGLTEYFRAIGRNFVLAAPTGKASKVISNKTKSPAYTLHRTIYSFKDIKEFQDNNTDGSETYKIYAELAINDQSADTVYIVDESSMISDVTNEEEFFKCGSGKLLSDFLKFVNLDHNDHRKKVILIGDDAQLPPIGMNFSPALNQEYLLKQYGIKSIVFELTEVLRQKSGSGVMHNSTNIRKSLKNNIFNQLIIESNYSDIHKLKHEDLLKEYLNSCDRKINGESIILAHSNADVAAHNKEIRQLFFPHHPNITAGDKVMAVSNNNAYGFFISNGEFGLVREVTDEIEQRTISIKRKNHTNKAVEKTNITLTFKDIVVSFRNFEGKTITFETKILEDLLYSDQANLTSDENKALYIDFCMRNQHLKPQTQAFKDTLLADPYFNALRLKFGYAITCHKAQGSEWNNVFVKCKKHQNQLSAGYFRWLYTAITRTSNNLYLLDAPNIKLGAGIKVVNNPNFKPPSSRPEGESNLTEKNINTNLEAVTIDESNTFGIPAHAQLSLEILKRVKQLLKGSDLSIHDVNQAQYLEIYYFEKNNEITRIDIGYNGKGKITRITTLTDSELGQTLKNILAPINGALVIPDSSNTDTEFYFDKDFLNDYHNMIVPLIKEKSINIKNVEAKNYMQRYTFTHSGECAVIDIYYNGKNNFTKCAPVNNLCTSDSLLSEILTIITLGFNA